MFRERVSFDNGAGGGKRGLTGNHSLTAQWTKWVRNRTEKWVAK